MKKVLKIAALFILSVIALILLYIGITFPPVMAGMAAKTVCSCVFVTGRTLESVKEKELQVFPGLSSATLTLNEKDSTVTAKILWRTSKAIFRTGLGCTLLASLEEEEVRKQKIRLAGSPTVNLDSLPWPTGNITNDSLFPPVNRDRINQALEEAFTENDPQKPVFTHAVVAVYNGQIIGERYASGFDRHSKMTGWSMTKSIINALIGILVKDGKLTPESPAPVPEWKEDARREITLNHLLQASSGLKWSESYFIPTSDFHNMFIRSDDKAAYAASRKLNYAPGTHFEYSSGTTNILSRIIRQTVGDRQYYTFPYEKLFYKIGMNHVTLEPDASGTFVGSSYSYASARDWARFGMLYLNEGAWNGEQILPVGWVKYTTTPATATDRGQYGAQWWLNAGRKDNAAIRIYPELPADAYWADGFEEQYVMVIPSKNLVIVRLGVSHHGFDFTKLATEIIASLPQ
jgi:CubicO group peptidase (beta-lactamase class C family)